MDGDVSTPQTDQISLYGLFGDSSATLQGLNDHLSPSLLQRSPPCGSVVGTQTSLTKVVTSPNKVIFNGVQQGVLLSDLADRSPSAGSVTVASLCSYVSFDNLRCTNLVTRKGNRFCGLHSKDVFERPSPSTNLKKTVSFTPLTQLKPCGPVSVNTSSSTFSTMKAMKLDVKNLAPGGVKSKSVVVKDTSNPTLKSQQNQVCFVRKVGQQITVTARPIGMKNAETNAKSIQTSTENSPVKAMTSTEILSKPKSRMVLKSGNPEISSSEVIPSTNRMSVSNAKPNGMDEDVLKKVVEVLNSGNDLTSQQQISLLQSMGITVVHGSPAIAKNLIVRKKKPSKPVVRRVITIGNAKNLASAASPFSSPSVVPSTLIPAINQSQSRLLHGSQNSSTLSPIRPLPSAIGPRTKEPTTEVQHSVSKSELKGSLSVCGNSATVMEPSAWQTVRTSQVLDTTKKGTRGSSKVALKRKEKSLGGGSFLPEKFSRGHANITYNAAKKPRLSSPSFDKPCQQKKNIKGKSVSNLLMKSCPPPIVLVAPLGSASCVQRLTKYLNAKVNLDNFLFESVPTESGEKVEADKNKTLKSKLLKRYLAWKRSQIPGKFKYKQCLKNLKGTDFCKSFLAARALLNLLQHQSQGRQTIVHHEKILQAILEDDFECAESLEEGDVLVPYDRSHDHDMDEVTAFTLKTEHLRNKYKQLMCQLDAEESDLRILQECHEVDPLSTRKLLNLMTEAVLEDNSNQHMKRPPLRRCHLSSDHGLSCKAPALPYASYCHQHIWYCQNQCLYKLDQNMKPAADICPEPLVKKVRKRAKFFPLIKRYKKKKRRKTDGSDGHNPEKGPLNNDIAMPVLQQVAGSSMQSTIHMQSQLNEGALPGGNIKPMKVDDSDLEDAKPSDSDDEDLDLTTNEIMLSGVLDKLPDDPNDIFDLFTTDKGAEELERALLLAASSPSHDHGENGMDIPDYHNSGDLLSGSPSAIINCDAPKSKERPPPLESFDKSQCVHYTFGSISVSKNETSSNGLEAGDEVGVGPLISAEDLKDIEGVIERFDAEDVNSPKLPSSPAVDQYTSMLARQLSQEVETESLKQLSTPMDSKARSAFPNLKESVTLSRSYSLPTSSIRSVYSTVKSDVANGAVTLGEELRHSGVVHNITALCSSSGTQSSSDGKSHVTLQKSLSEVPQPAVLSPRQVQKMPSAQVVSNARSISTVNLPSMQVASESLKEISTTASTVKGQIPVSPRTPQPKSSQSASVVSSPVLPVTLMQSPSQSGNVIKVIVPPGTMVNGTNGQQNMLLIPVSALMKQNALQANSNIQSNLIPGISSQGTATNVRMSNLQTGQQFFIVNNHAGSAQTHLALAQRPVNNATQQPGVFAKPSPKSVVLQKNEIGKQHFGNRTQGNVKMNLNECLKQNQASKQHALSSIDAGNSPGSKSGGGNSGVVCGTTPPEIKVKSTMANLKGRETLQGRRVKSSVKKVRARFDPVAKRYVSSTSIAASTPVAPAPAATSNNPNLTENLKKFNASALSIQTKVQQIDSVLSSLNAAKNCQPQSKRVATSNAERKGESMKPGVDKVPVSSPSPHVPTQATAAGSSLSQSPSARVFPEAATNTSSKEKHIKRQKTNPGKQSKATPKKTNSVSINTSASNKVSDSTSVTAAAASSGTVHWNQTTTAGPEVTTTTLTVPVYITGALPAGTWPGDLALKGSLAGASLPVILPAHKISPHCHVPQRVLLGSIGSLAVRSQVVSVASSTSTVKPTRTIITPVSMPLNCNTVLQNSTGRGLQQSTVPVTKIAEDGLLSQVKVLSENSQTQSAAKPNAHGEVIKKKTGRKTNHSNILHDPLMFDPTASDGSLPSVS